MAAREWPVSDSHARVEIHRVRSGALHEEKIVRQVANISTGAMNNEIAFVR